ncbi:MAG: response regulator transcription factor [Clostridiales bacterium]|nr:response regulator transcription factor [Clostridiales bacterium]
MPIIHDIEQYYAQNPEDYVRKLCEPLFREFGFSYFHYVRYYDDQRVFDINTHTKYSMNFVKKGFNSGYGLLPKSSFIKRWAFLDLLINDPQRREFLKSYDIYDGFGLVIKNCHFIESFDFAWPHFDTELYLTCLNNINHFKKFCLYFKTQASEHIEFHRKNTMLMPPSCVATIATLSKKKLALDEIKKYYIDHNHQEIALTPREFECYKLLATGCSMKMIASRLDISIKTVEFHLNNIKSKLGVHSKYRLIQLFFENDLTYWL